MCMVVAAAAATSASATAAAVRVCMLCAACNELAAAVVAGRIVHKCWTALQAEHLKHLQKLGGVVWRGVWRAGMKWGKVGQDARTRGSASRRVAGEGAVPWVADQLSGRQAPCEPRAAPGQLSFLRPPEASPQQPTDPAACLLAGDHSLALYSSPCMSSSQPQPQRKHERKPASHSSRGQCMLH